MDCSVLLPFGTQEEVIAVTKQTLREGMVGGAYMFSPCTDLTDSCNLDNVLAMMQTWKKFGHYPIST
jgi:uroporphyrinogen-III decarboxylase